MSDLIYFVFSTEENERNQYLVQILIDNEIKYLFKPYHLIGNHLYSAYYFPKLEGLIFWLKKPQNIDFYIVSCLQSNFDIILKSPSCVKHHHKIPIQEIYHPNSKKLERFLQTIQLLI